MLIKPDVSEKQIKGKVTKYQETLESNKKKRKLYPLFNMLILVISLCIRVNTFRYLQLHIWVNSNLNSENVGSLAKALM